MKILYEKISSNERQILEVIVLIVVIFVPWVVDLQELFRKYLNSHPISPDDFFWQVAIRTGRPVASVILFIALLLAIRKFNQGFVMNRKRVYHDHSYAWYWICSKILGIKSCDLVLVPIPTQFKLVIRATFPEYPLDETEYPVVENELDSIVSVLNKEALAKEINLILEDTYAIEEWQIPKSKHDCKTIKISRNNGADNSRHFSQKYVEAIIKCIRGLADKVLVNVYATTNPMNTKHIATRVFGLGERGNVEHLYVFQQSKDGRRRFEEKGRKIF
jgi:hypothetical protein